MGMNEQIKMMQDEADILLNIGNTIPGMVPSKIFEYMSTGKPIISTSCIQNDPVITYLEHYGNAHVINEKETIETEVSRLKEYLAGKNVQVHIQISQQSKLFNNTPDAYVFHLESLAAQ